MVTARPLATVEHNDKPATVGKEAAIMDQLTHLGDDARHQPLAHADQQRPAERLLALPGPPAAPSVRPGVAADRAPQDRPSVAESYDHYYSSGLYDARYPRPNLSTYRSALRLVRASSSCCVFG